MPMSSLLSQACLLLGGCLPCISASVCSSARLDLSKFGASGLPSAAGELLSSGLKARGPLSAEPVTPSASLVPHLPVDPQVALHQDRPPPA